MHTFYQQESGQDAGDIFGDASQSSQQQQQQQSSSQPPSFQQQLLGTMQQANMELLGNLLGTQDTSTQPMQSQSHPTQAISQALLEQQIKLNLLQQLLQQQQQLQNEIMQQQMGLLSGQTSFSLPPIIDRSRDTQQYGLPTPASSTELRAQQNTDFISPMLLHSNNNAMGTMVQNPPMLPNYMPQQMLPSAPHSAPANIVFNTQAIPISPGELDFNELHIPSPFLGPHSNAGSASQVGASSQNNSGARASASMGKRRNASSSGDESSVTSKPARKRQSPAIRAPSIGPSSSRRGSVRGTRSANSTPLFPAPVSSTRPSPAQRSMHGSNDVPGDTPSPVDPPMPPPVHPASYTPPVMTSNPSTTSSSPPLPSTPASPAVAVPPSQITPVTPASMLKLGRLAMSSALTTQEDPSAQKQREGKSGGRSSGSKARATDKVANISLTSPALKPIRPAGNAVMTPMTASPTSPFTQPMHVRKTSHKAAEQKRRDSLKTSFDDLRVLLPPIPLPSDEGFPDEPILPGAMPPRGPPKGNAEGPNRGVSKLQLLRCGNEFIKILKGRVERRDEEIAKLRQEVKRLRDLVGEEAAKPPAGQEMIDLERDLDACEISTGNIFKRTRALSITEGDGEDEGDY